MSVEIKNLSYTYSVGSPFQKDALHGISVTINEGEMVGIIGSTGSGKSTLVQHINGLIKLTSGSIKVYDIDLTAKKPDLKRLRSMVGMLFQYPEYQLFEETVLKDVAFGPMNFGATKEEALAAAEEAIRLVGLDFDEVKDKSPFELSGGEKRRAAIAGVIASKPKILVLDEPTAGLDPIGKREILNLILSLKKAFVKTVIMISHNMDEIAEFCGRVLVLSEGRLIADCTPAELFEKEYSLEGTGLTLPHTVNIKRLLGQKGLSLKGDTLSAPALADAIAEALRRRV
ncbi:MAG TPA: energy-coupling factor transporter ATPase [Clostridia bacterium]|jgi:energy-coupling factor transport system ATP-binding protein|nr:energy-coupling factor transporter ATPase [Clostridia bacterium]HOK82104.1 energy-coupling factor transporter ATPase [Clostridia bacterium]HOL61044.1 energy-coupling factor transporter ATPase [Clostridia bacterium]HPO53956.1 energy-coupling factor transporter ATPase [Clostridia bacterium]